MGDPAEENDPPPESRRSLAKGALSVNSKTKKSTVIHTFGTLQIECGPEKRFLCAHSQECELMLLFGPVNGSVPAAEFDASPSARMYPLALQDSQDK